MDDIFKKVNQIYNKTTFLDKYGGDLYITIFLLLLFFVVISYFSVLNQIQPIKADWVNNRCKPHVMPFAGIINAPEGVNKLDFTIQNFNGCVNSILSQVSQMSIQPFNFLTILSGGIMSGFINTITSMKNKFNDMRNDFNKYNIDVLSYSTNITTPIMEFSILFKDTIGKMKGIFASIIFTLYGSYMSLQGATRVMYDFSVTLIIGLVGLIIILWLIPFFGWGIATALTAVFIVVIIPIAQTSVILKSVLKLTGLKDIPNAPKGKKVKRCFHPNTMIKLIDNKIIPINKIKIGSILTDGSIVVGIMKTSPEEHEFYKVRDIIVTGTHKVFDNIKSEWILVENHPESIKINNYDENIMYCLSTDTKYIKINNLYFSDWDELTKENIIELKNNMENIINERNNSNDNKERNNIVNNKYTEYKCIHKYIDGGVNYNTPIELIDGTYKNISDIQLNDILKYGEKVVGLVKLDSNINYICEYNLDNIKIIGANIVSLSNKFNKINTTLIVNDDNNFIRKNKIKYLYHLVTDKTTFHIDNIKIGDYNSNLDINLTNSKKDILLSLI